MGEDKNGPFQLSFNSAVRVDYQGARVTSDGGLILMRELDERLGLSADPPPPPGSDSQIRQKDRGVYLTSAQLAKPSL